MPIYEYECNACSERHEFIQKFSEAPKRKCPSCGKSRLRKLVSAAAFHLKGSGWYVTDFRDQNKKKDGKDDKSAGKSDRTDGQSDSKSDRTDGQSDSKSDTKSDTKSDGASGSTAESKSGAKSEPKADKKAAANKGDSSATAAGQ